MTQGASQLQINSQFDGGNIECIDCTSAQNIRLSIKADHNSRFLQWFYFRLSGAKGLACKLHLSNADQGAFPSGWENYRAVASYDREDWFRIDTHYTGEQLILDIEPTQDFVYIAYFAPYSLERQASFVSKIALSPLVNISELGQTLDGRALDKLTICSPNNAFDSASNSRKINCWIIARQHPGETMAAWWMEGFLERLIDSNDPVARQLLGKAVFNVVPNMNPDGSFRGHLRTNAAGINLNREWQDTTLEKSPEVFHVRKAMEKSGVDFCLDVHGDEALPHNFIAGAEGIPGWNEQLEQLNKRYQTALQQANPDFQTIYGYPLSAPGTADLRICTNYIAETFSCQAMTLEMPFKDSSHTPDQRYGWSPKRCQKLGAATLDALFAVIDEIHAVRQ